VEWNEIDAECVEESLECEGEKRFKSWKFEVERRGARGDR
jgi:hypothetical protein